MGSKGSQTTTTNQMQTYAPNPAIGAAGTQALTAAQQASQAPFQQPVAPVAPFNPYQLLGFGETLGAQGMAQPYFGLGSGYLMGSAAPVTGQDVAGYYNPMAQNVFANLQDIFGQQMRETTGQATQLAGGVGADRIGVAQANLAKQQGLAAGQTASQLYQQALQAAEQQKQMMAGAGYGLGQMGPAAQAAQLQAIQALLGVGGQGQQLTQAQLNALYQNELARIAYPFQTAQYLAGITGGLAPAMGGTTVGQATTTQPSPTLAAQLLGIGTAGAGLYGAMGGGNPFAGGLNPSVPGATSVVGGAGSLAVPTFFQQGGGISDYGNLAKRGYLKELGSMIPAAESGNPIAEELYSDIGGSLPMQTGGTPSFGAKGSNIPFPTQMTQPSMPFSGTAAIPFGQQPQTPTPTTAVPQEQESGQSWNNLLQSNPQLSRLMQILSMKGSFFGNMKGSRFGNQGNMNLPSFLQNPQGMQMQSGGGILGLGSIGAKDFLSPLITGDWKTNPFTSMSILSGKSPFSTANLLNSLKQELQPSSSQGQQGSSSTSGSNLPDILVRASGLQSGGAADDTPPPFPGASIPKGLNPIPYVPMQGGPMHDTSLHFSMPSQQQSGSGGGGDGMSKAIGMAAQFLPMLMMAARGGGVSPFDVGQPFQAGGDAEVIDATDLPPIEYTPRTQAQLASDRAADDTALGFASPPPAASNPLATPTTFASPQRPTMPSPMGGLPQGQLPYPDATQRDFGQNLTRSPWLALIEAGARMAQTRGPIGSVIGAGLEAGAGELGRQRKALQSEEDINLKAQHLAQMAQIHLDEYTRMKPYQAAEVGLRQEALAQTKYSPVNLEITNAKGEPETIAARFNPKTGTYEDTEGKPVTGRLIARQTGAESATSRANEAFRSAKDDPDYFSDQIGTINKHRALRGLPPLSSSPEAATTGVPVDTVKDFKQGKFRKIKAGPDSDASTWEPAT